MAAVYPKQSKFLDKAQNCKLWMMRSQWDIDLINADSSACGSIIRLSFPAMRQSEEVVAAIIGHEMAHVLMSHWYSTRLLEMAIEVIPIAFIFDLVLKMNLSTIPTVSLAKRFHTKMMLNEFNSIVVSSNSVENSREMRAG